MFGRAITPRVAVSVVFVASMFVNIMDATIVNVALPTISRDFHIAAASSGAVAVGYLVSLAIFIPASGWVGDRFGTKRTVLLALAVFTGASALCGLAQSLPQLIAFRVLQGAGGGMLIPVGMAMLYRAFPPAERIRASRILTIPTATAPALGPVIGGLLVDQLSWRWVFYVNVPIGIAAFLFGLVFLPEHREKIPGRFDLPGFLLSGFGFAMLMYALSEGASRGWGSTEILATGLLGLLLVGVLVPVELRVSQPMINLRLYRDRLFRNTNLLTICSAAGFLGALYAFPLLLQDGLGMSALASGLNTFPEAIGVMTASQIVTRIYPRIGPRRLLTTGFIGVPLLLVSLGFIDGTTNLWLVRLVMFVLGLMMATIFLPTQAASLATISSADTGRGSTLYSAVRQLGSALGVAVLGTVIISVGPTTLTGSGPVPNLAAYHAAFFAAAGLVFAGLVFARAVRDRDAAGTMAPRRTDAPPAEGAGSIAGSPGEREPVGTPAVGGPAE
jgi:EmrB/QacA subfamily drug resistance transporter